MRPKPDLQATGIALEALIAFRQKWATIELPVIFAMEYPRRAHMPIQPIQCGHVSPLVGRLQPLYEREQVAGFGIVGTGFVFIDPYLGKIGQFVSCIQRPQRMGQQIGPSASRQNDGSLVNHALKGKKSEKTNNEIAKIQHVTVFF